MVNINKVCVRFCLLVVIMWCASPWFAEARPASKAVHLLKQADGAALKARQWGDEYYHGWETEDGYAIVFDAASRNWQYAINDTGGRLVGSGRVVGKDAPPKDADKHLRLKGSASENVKKAEFASLKKASVGAPSTGTGKFPVILINFSDTVTTYDKADFEKMLFGTDIESSTNTGSMNDYYREVSYGQYSISGEVAGWYAASNTHDYYGQDDPANKQHKDIYVRDLVYEAVQAADADVDFSQYALSGNCKVDAIVIVHQGTDQANTGIKTDIWSHQGYLSYSDSYPDGYISKDDCKTDPSRKVIVDKYSIQNETASEDGPMHMATVGVFVHEWGHVLGLPDFYDTDYSSEGTGKWDVMASGFNEVFVAEDSPAHFNPWAKYMLGWTTPVEVTAALSNQPIQQAETTAEVYKLGSGDASTGEYFLVENRQQTGFDQGLPSAGLLVWHVDADWIAYYLGSNDVNNYSCVPPSAACANHHYGVALVQADNKWSLERNSNEGDAGDPFPGSKNRRAFNMGTLPGSKFYDGSASNVHISDISDSSAVMTATMSAMPQYVLNAARTGVGAISADGMSCNSKGCKGTFDSGTSISLTPAAGKGYVFKEWTGCTSVSGTVCTVTLGANTTVTAVFAKTFTLTVTKKSGSGVVIGSPDGINCGNICKAQYMSATSVTLTAVPDEGYALLKWTGCASSSGDTCTVKMGGNRTVTAKFAAQ